MFSSSRNRVSSPQKKNLRVCYIVSTFPREENDPEVPWLVECVRRLRDKGVEVEIFAPSFRGLKDHEIFGIPVHRFRYFPKRWEMLTHDEGAPNKIMSNPFYKYLAVPYILFGMLDAIFFFGRNRFDILHVHWPFPHALFGWIGRWICGAKVILNFHGAEVLLVHRYPIIRSFLRVFLRRADHVVTNSSFTKEKVTEVYRRPVTVIPFGITVERDGHAKRSSTSVKTILFVGRLIERKGVEYLIQAMPYVLRKVKARLVIVGEGHRRPFLEELVAREGLKDVVQMVGKVSEESLKRWYEICDVFVLPAVVDSKGDTEGLGVVLLEALSYGKPVVASNVGGIPDIVIDGQTGLLVPEKDPKALEEAIVYVLTHEHFSQRLGEKGRKYVEEQFGWEKITDKLIDLYRNAIRDEDSTFNLR